MKLGNNINRKEYKSIKSWKKQTIQKYKRKVMGFGNDPGKARLYRAGRKGNGNDKEDK